MGLTYHFTFSAPATVTADELLNFLRKVEKDAKKMGFRPTTVWRPNLTRRNGASSRGG